MADIPFFSRYDAMHRGIDFSRDCSGPTMTRQSHKDECDLNLIMRRFAATGILPAARPGAMYGDFSSVGDYQTSLGIIERARSQFAALPSVIRERFKNDPSLMLAFVSDPANRDEAIKLGLVVAPEAPPKVENPAAGDLAKPKA